MNADDQSKQARAAEQKLKESLLALGLLSEITPPLDVTGRRPDREPAPVADDSVSERVLRERR
jgi:hypothetical protein